MKKTLAFDFGASGGRAMLGTFDGRRIHLEEVHRFSNDPVIVNGVMYWDVLRLLFEIKQSLIRVKKYGKVDSLGIDTWGVDFGLLDGRGNLLSNPVHYRDDRTFGMLNESSKKITPNELYRQTGNQLMELNTLFQILSIKQNNPEDLDRAKTLLLMPDLLNYFLTGKKVSERSIASTTQLYDPYQKNWSRNIMDTFGIPTDIFMDIVESGTVIGKTTSEINTELGIDPIHVVAVAGHDTQCAQVAVPAFEKKFAFLSCGTWSILGTELESPKTDNLALSYNITNESGFDNKTSFMKNIVGLWLIQESKRQWAREGYEISFSELESQAWQAEPFKAFIDPDDPIFGAAGDMPSRIKDNCKNNGQRIPETVGEIVRTINESLALKYRLALEELEECTASSFPALYMVGGGIQSDLLCQMTANAIGRPVYAGPVEATVLGNIAIQLMASGNIKSLSEARTIIRESQNIKKFIPQDIEEWQHQFEKYKKEIVK